MKELLTPGGEHHGIGDGEGLVMTKNEDPPLRSPKQTPGQYIECTCQLTATKSNQDRQQHGNYRLTSINMILSDQHSMFNMIQLEQCEHGIT